MKRSLTFRYSLQQIAYWAAAAGVMSFASAFLIEKGFATSQVGILLASGNLLSCAVQPILADRADRAGAHVVVGFIVFLTSICTVCFGLIQFMPLPKFMFGLMYLIGIFTFDAMMPLLNSVVVVYNEQDYHINFGLSRGLGSFAYSIAALGIGKVIAGWGADWMIWIVIALLIMNLNVCLGFPKLKERKNNGHTGFECCSIPVFFGRYRWYCFSLLGIMLLAMFH
ncbi:MAG: MFS transporter, partial [Oscillospiraceae bacterium]|nr:MFS transporter [Oscillospiraceae bacterium]